MQAATQREVTNAAVCDPVAKQQLTEKALKGFRQYGTIARAAKVAKVDRRTLKSWLQNDPVLALKFKDIDEDVTDGLEEDAIRRARKGSDGLLSMLLAARNKRYQTKQIIELTQQLNLDNVMEKMRQICIAQPTLAPFIESALENALIRIREGRVLEHVS